VFVVVREEARSAVAVIHDFIAGCLQLFGEPRAHAAGAFSLPRKKLRRWRARNQGNFFG